MTPDLPATETETDTETGAAHRNGYNGVHHLHPVDDISEIIDIAGMTEQVRARLDQRRGSERSATNVLMNGELHRTIDDGRRVLDDSIAEERVAPLGRVAKRTDVKSSIPEFLYLPEYQVAYPQVVVEALGELYAEYNRAFAALAEANREWDTDYQHMYGADGMPMNQGVQIDMVGLPEGFLEQAKDMDPRVVKEVLRGRIFEIENSLAMYQFLSTIFSREGESGFRTRFNESLDDLRKRHGKPVALLAVTDQKHKAMRELEFGKRDGEELTPAEVREMSGFDAFFGPEEFQRHLAENGGESTHLLYVRSSDPVAKLKKPTTVVEVPLLSDPVTRRAIKAHAVTFNIDAPDMPFDRRINDTKEYQLPMGMAHPVRGEADIFAPEFLAYMAKVRNASYAGYQGGSRLAPAFAAYLQSLGVDPAAVDAGTGPVRLKPMKTSYGCYGHLSGTLSEREMRTELRRNLVLRGAYVAQPERPQPVMVNSSEEGDQARCGYIDRNFFGMVDGKPQFLGGFRSLMPTTTAEAQKGRNHGNASTIWAEIKPEEA